MTATVLGYLGLGVLWTLTVFLGGWAYAEAKRDGGRR